MLNRKQVTPVYKRLSVLVVKTIKNFFAEFGIKDLNTALEVRIGGKETRKAQFGESRPCNPIHIFQPSIQAQHLCPCTLCAAFHEMLKIVKRLYDYVFFQYLFDQSFFLCVSVPLQNTSKLTCFFAFKSLIPMHYWSQIYRFYQKALSC